MDVLKLILLATLEHNPLPGYYHPFMTLGTAGDRAPSPNDLDMQMRQENPAVAEDFKGFISTGATIN